MNEERDSEDAQLEDDRGDQAGEQSSADSERSGASDHESAEELLVGDGEWEKELEEGTSDEQGGAEWESDGDREAGRSGERVEGADPTGTPEESTGASESETGVEGDGGTTESEFTGEIGATTGESAGGGSSGLPSPGDVTGDSGDSDRRESASEESDGQSSDLEPPGPEIEEAELEELGGPPSLPEQPDDVKGSRETPDRQLEFRSGERVGGRFTVERYLGSSGGGISYLCREEESGAPVVIKVLSMPAPDEEHLKWIREKIRTASRIRADHLTDILGMGTTEEGKVYVAMNYTEGQSLSRALAEQREQGREVTPAEMFHVVAQICDGLEAIHEHLVHGLLTPFNIYIAEDGVVQIQNLGFGQISARHLHAQGEGPFHESIYVAPEVAANPENLGPRADLYSAGMIVAEMLSGGGLPREVGEARDVAVRIARTYSAGIHRLVGTSLAEDPSKRTSSIAEFRMALENAVREAGVEPKDGLPETGLRVQPAVEIRDEEADLFDVPGPDESGGREADETDERYLVRKEGLDYGPFTREEVLEQLYDDEIDEHTSVLDRAIQERAPLGEQEAFVDEVEEYIPIRAERRRKERERRQQIERRVKQGGKAVLVVGIFAGLVVLVGMSYYYFTRPDPKELPVEKAFVALEYEFLPPPKEFKTVSADEDVLEKIFNPEAANREVPEQIRRARRGTGGGTGGTGGGGEGATPEGESTDQEVSTVDMGSSEGSDTVLTDKKINNIILSDFSVLRGCVQKELENNPSFDGVTVKFYIRPNGTTGGVTLREKQYLERPVGRCLVREFRQMEFPAHSAVSNKGVTFPLQIQR